MALGNSFVEQLWGAAWGSRSSFEEQLYTVKLKYRNFWEQQFCTAALKNYNIGEELWGGALGSSFGKQLWPAFRNKFADELL
jgi:hypothetical protein